MPSGRLSLGPFAKLALRYGSLGSRLPSHCPGDRVRKVLELGTFLRPDSIVSIHRLAFARVRVTPDDS